MGERRLLAGRKQAVVRPVLRHELATGTGPVAHRHGHPAAEGVQRGTGVRDPLAVVRISAREALRLAQSFGQVGGVPRRAPGLRQLVPEEAVRYLPRAGPQVPGAPPPLLVREGRERVHKGGVAGHDCEGGLPQVRAPMRN